MPHLKMSLKGRYYAPMGTKFFPFRVAAFQNGLVCRNGKWKSQKLSPVQKGGKSTKCLQSPERPGIMVSGYHSKREHSTNFQFQAPSPKENHCNRKKFASLEKDFEKGDITLN